MTAMVQRLYEHPHHRGSLPLADAVGRVGVPDAGQFVTVYLQLDGRCISDAWFETHNCPVAVACGSFVTAWATGRNIAHVHALGPEDLAGALGKLPFDKEHCPRMAVAALHAAAREAARSAPRNHDTRPAEDMCE
ncbi:MAG: iron-sulfur cluster assembly scaffold protein [Armatimonadetes bacterium]|nr:iron-sulfur cluster assembly scaffold protein [Armatimonadota bacterium]